MENPEKSIFHIDLNAFFAACEVIKNPELKGKPIVVGGSSRRSVVSTASYEARKYGIHSAMSVYEAKKLCPNVTIVSVHGELYREYSQKFFSVLREYTDIIEVASVDEAYLDVTDLCAGKDSVKIASKIQLDVKKRTQLECSIGIAENRFLAKMASNMKKPMGITYLNKGNLKKLLWPLAIGKMHGIGKKTAPKLTEIGINTIGDLARYEDIPRLKKILGKNTENFLKKTYGISNDEIVPNRYADSSSIGNERTFESDLLEESIILKEFKKISNKVCERVINKKLIAKTISIKIRYNDFKTINRSNTINKPTNEEDIVYNIVCDLFDNSWNGKPIRLIGVTLSNLVEKSDYKEQLDLFTYHIHKSDEPIIRVINEIREKYGDKIIKKGFKK